MHSYSPMSEFGFEAKTNLIVEVDDDISSATKKTWASDDEEYAQEEDSKSYRRNSFDLRGCFTKKLVIIEDDFTES